MKGFKLYKGNNYLGCGEDYANDIKRKLQALIVGVASVGIIIDSVGYYRFKFALHAKAYGLIKNLFN